MKLYTLEELKEVYNIMLKKHSLEFTNEEKILIGTLLLKELDKINCNNCGYKCINSNTCHFLLLKENVKMLIKSFY